MKTIKLLIAIAVTILCASLLLLGEGFERIGQVALSLYALICCAVLFTKENPPREPLMIRIIARLAHLYVVLACAYTGHSIIAFVLGAVWVLAWAQRASRELAAEKKTAE